MSKKIAFLDRDGVINEKALEHEYIKCWEEFHFKAGAIAGIRLLRDAGYRIVIVTNQRGIARGIMTIQDLEDIHAKMVEVLKINNADIDAIYYCPHEVDTCICRKPGIGMFLQAEKIFEIEKKKSIMIGDSLSDIEAGQRYGVASYLLKNNQMLDELVRGISV